MNINNYKYYYFVGIGGIGMSALARYFLYENKGVYGYDRTESVLSKKLEEEGAHIMYIDDYTLIPKNLQPDDTLVIYTPAIKKSDLLDWFDSNGFKIVKRSKALAEVTQDSRCIAIAGTHGKTTTTTLLAYLLKESGFPAMSFLGGISENYGGNFIINGNDYSVVEADEFDKSFLTLSPYYACITSVDADHLDIYGDKEQFAETFQKFADSVQADGKLFLKKGEPIHHSHISYSTEEEADYFAENIQLKFPYSTFDLNAKGTIIKDFEIQLQGKHNIENATAALAMALELGVDANKLKSALKNFKGIQRRFTIKEFPSGKIYIDDYAHHPTELNASIQAVNSLFPDKKKLFIFQPHLFSRTKDFGDEFAKSLNAAEQLLLLDIYPAREEPMEGITSQWLADKMDRNVEVQSLKEAMNAIENYDYEVIVTLGAGDIDSLSPLIIKKLTNEA